MDLKSQFTGFPATLKRAWLPIALTVVVAVVFFGGTITALYNRARAKVPALPAPKA
jgi:hypothetical protein